MMTVKAIEFKTVWEDGRESVDYELFEDFQTWLQFKRECATDCYTRCNVTALEVVSVCISKSEFDSMSNSLYETHEFAYNAIDNAMKRIFK